MQVADLREALALKELEVEELKAARDYMPTSVSVAKTSNPDAKR